MQEDLIYTRREAAHCLKLCESSLDQLIRTGVIKVSRRGRRVFIPRSEIERVAAKPLGFIWPPKHNHKTTRHFHPEDQGARPKPPARAVEAGAEPLLKSSLIA